MLSALGINRQNIIRRANHVTRTRHWSGNRPLVADSTLRPLSRHLASYFRNNRQETSDVVMEVPVSPKKTTLVHFIDALQICSIFVVLAAQIGIVVRESTPASSLKTVSPSRSIHSSIKLNGIHDRFIVHQPLALALALSFGLLARALKSRAKPCVPLFPHRTLGRVSVAFPVTAFRYTALFP
jgi:hypothetical protein